MRKAPRYRTSAIFGVVRMVVSEECDVADVWDAGKECDTFTGDS